MLFNNGVLVAITELQQKNPHLILCGSAALIMLGILENRHMSDIDFAVNDEAFIRIPTLPQFPDPYSELNSADGYKSHSGYYQRFKINTLVFEDHIPLYSEEFNGIKHQRLEDIINWKEKYNRPKDIKDLEKITIKAIEEALYKES